MDIQAVVTLKVTTLTGTTTITADCTHAVGDNLRLLAPNMVHPTVEAAAQKSVAALIAALNPAANKAALSGEY